MHVAIAGGGIFGSTAALALARRGHRVTLIDAGRLPHPLAESTDISKVVRLDYGGDELYTALAERALDGWRAWNRAAPGDPLFHETGVTFLARRPLAPGGFEHDSFALLTGRGHRLERLDAAAIARRFPAYRPGAMVDGYFNPAGGWVTATRTVERVLAEARALGVEVRERCPARAIDRDRGDLLLAGGRLAADHVLVAAGAWTPLLCPWLAGPLRARGQAVFHLRPADGRHFAADRFPVFGLDIARTGFYGFPLAAGGVVKIGHHGPGVEVAMDSDERVVPAAVEADLGALLADVLPGLADAEIAFRRLCVYGDTGDEHFWIARDPDRPRLTVAAGGSGHGFKFAPVLGDLIADAVLGAPVPDRFGWRTDVRSGGEEAARFRGD
ncbi:MAG TPA: FAD-dependent oxidoreductase [Kofleriaceae bacterium]|nr:FAD-dependent oxidoreductase [Kofleriaceae bacterium]